MSQSARQCASRLPSFEVVRLARELHSLRLVIFSLRLHPRASSLALNIMVLAMGTGAFLSI